MASREVTLDRALAKGLPGDGARHSIQERIALMEPQARLEMLTALGPDTVAALRRDWLCTARPSQLPPAGEWFTWLVMAGRGFGKTRAGAEWVRGIAERNGAARIALVGASLQEARHVMVEGESGLLAIAPRHTRPQWYPSRRELIWRNGARAVIHGAADPEMLRGPQHSHAWADEIGKWPRGTVAWENLVMGLRLGRHPQIVATTTPRSVALVRKLASDPMVRVTHGRTQDNLAALPQTFIAEMERSFGDSRLGRQELGGELLLDIEGALWTRDLLDACLLDGPPPDRASLARVVVGVDPPAGSAGDACGIIVAGMDENGHAIVLEDASVEKATPQRWAAAVATAAARWSADRVVAEANNGGEMVGAVLRAADMALPVRLVHASRGKTARAEPVAAAYEARRVRHARPFSALEDELCGLLSDGRYEGPGRSPDRADALVWCLTELVLGPVCRPQIRRL